MEKVIEYFDNKEWEEEISEFAFLHDDDCCVNTEDGCDVGTENLNCCCAMKTIRGIIERVIKDRDKYWSEMIKASRKHNNSEENKSLTKIKKNIKK